MTYDIIYLLKVGFFMKLVIDNLEKSFENKKVLNDYNTFKVHTK